MKLSAQTIMIAATVLGVIAGIAKDRQAYKLAVAAAKAAGQPVPDFDVEACVLHVVTALTIALGAGAGASQLPGVQ